MMVAHSWLKPDGTNEPDSKLASCAIGGMSRRFSRPGLNAAAVSTLKNETNVAILQNAGLIEAAEKWPHAALDPSLIDFMCSKGWQD